MHIPADVLNDSCGCSTVPLKLNDLTSAPSRHYYCMAPWPFLLIRTAVHYSQTGKKSKGCCYKARESLPLKPSSELWMNLWFNKLWCINRWLWRCVFGKSAWSKQEKRLLGQEFQTVYSEQTGEEDHNISWSINGSVGIYGHLLWSWISAPAECCHHTFIQWWINNSN